MRYKLQCLDCNATCWVRGSEDSDDGSVELDIDVETLWYDNENSSTFCQHEDFEVITSEVEEDFEDNVI